MLQYESSYSRTRNDAKKTEEKNPTTTFSNRYAYSAGYQRDSSAPRETGKLMFEIVFSLKKISFP